MSGARCRPALAHGGPVPNARWRSSVCLCAADWLMCWGGSVGSAAAATATAAAHLALVLRCDYRPGCFHHCDVIPPL